MKDTKGESYANRLEKLSGARWKQVLDVQRPYRWNLRRLDLGRTLDVGCGIGRHLSHLPGGSVGVDHNEHSVAVSREAGHQAYTVEEFFANDVAGEGTFDSMLLAHVLEHMPAVEARKLVEDYLPYVNDKVVVICPQEKGFTTDETHVNFLRHEDIALILTELGLSIDRSYSFPFPKRAGRWFTHNETVVVAHKQK